MLGKGGGGAPRERERGNRLHDATKHVPRMSAFLQYFIIVHVSLWHLAHSHKINMHIAHNTGAYFLSNGTSSLAGFYVRFTLNPNVW